MKLGRTWSCTVRICSTLTHALPAFQQKKDGTASFPSYSKCCIQGIRSLSNMLLWGLGLGKGLILATLIPTNLKALSKAQSVQQSPKNSKRTDWCMRRQASALSASALPRHIPARLAAHLDPFSFFGQCIHISAAAYPTASRHFRSPNETSGGHSGDSTGS